MGRLITEESVIDVLKQTGIIQDNDLGHLVVDEINRIPTAYDVDKVVEDLENASFWEGYSYDEDGYSNDTEYQAIGLYRAEEIVRKGGVNE